MTALSLLFIGLPVVVRRLQRGDQVCIVSASQPNPWGTSRDRGTQVVWGEFRASPGKRCLSALARQLTP